MSERGKEREKGGRERDPHARFEFAIIMALLVKLSISQVIYVDCSSRASSSLFPSLYLSVPLSFSFCPLPCPFNCSYPTHLVHPMSIADLFDLIYMIDLRFGPKWRRSARGTGSYMFSFSALVIRRLSLCEKRALPSSIINCF